MITAYRAVIRRIAIHGPAVPRDRDDLFESLEALHARLESLKKDGRKPILLSLVRTTAESLHPVGTPELEEFWDPELTLQAKVGDYVQSLNMTLYPPFLVHYVTSAGVCDITERNYLSHGHYRIVSAEEAATALQNGSGRWGRPEEQS